MKGRKLFNCIRNLFISIVIGVWCLRSFAETSVIPRRDPRAAKDEVQFNAVDLSCPLPGENQRQGACSDLCHHDDECPGNQLCCTDGCKKLCTDPLLPPPVFDWERQPIGNQIAGNNWLVQGPPAPAQGETCSTSTPGPGIPPLSCPEGFTCVIQDDGDPSRGIPNRGVCVEYEEDTNIIPALRLSVEEDILEAKCIMDGRELKDGEIFYRRCNMCACNGGYLRCEVQDCDEEYSGDDE